MKRFTLVLTLCLTFCFPSYAQTKPSTQSTPPERLRLKLGEHRISIKQAGYVLWERTMTLSAGGNITVDATLEKVP